ncbi:MAG: hypothetical protein JW705_09925, partial [Methanosarcinaceae archaeon]|nr:hypothetical protein [Methanosarcinaceae archaeon]
MSEFPWEVKKDPGKGSSGEGVSVPDNPVNADKMSAASPIPDLLANAFAGAPMEEIKLDPAPSTETVGRQNTTPAPPAFGNLADIPELVSDGAGPSAGPSPQPAGDLPPFMNKGNAIEGEAGNSERSSSGPLNIGGISPDPAGEEKPVQEGRKVPEKSAKKSPPPLFKPVLPGEDVREPVAGAGHEVFSKNGYEELSGPGANFTPLKPVFGNAAAYASTFPDLSHDHVKPAEDRSASQPDPAMKKAPGPVNPFPGSLFTMEGPSENDAVFGNPFSAQVSGPAAAQPEYVEPSVNPFSSPFEEGKAASSGQTEGLADPFSDQVPPSPDPFADPAPSAGDPFSDTVPA